MEIDWGSNPIKGALGPHFNVIREIPDQVLEGMEIIPGYGERISKDEIKYQTPIEGLTLLTKKLKEMLPGIGHIENSAEEERQKLYLYQKISELFRDNKAGELRKKAASDGLIKTLIYALSGELEMCKKLIDNSSHVITKAMPPKSDNYKMLRNLAKDKIYALTDALRYCFHSSEWNPMGDFMCEICQIMTGGVALQDFQSADHDCLNSFNCVGKQFVKMMVNARELKEMKTHKKMIDISPPPPPPPKVVSRRIDENRYDEYGNIAAPVNNPPPVDKSKPVEKIIPTVSNEEQNSLYRKLLKDRIFRYADFTLDNTKLNQYCSGNSSKNAEMVKRVTKEVAELRDQLPSEATHSIFVVAHSNRIDVLKAIIIGAEGTPYAHGAFEFIIYLPADYPSRPPHVSLLTTGYGTVRFNPNLYACGKVCLSLLGTWSGRNASEQWNPKTSNLSQVLLSIQSLVMVDRVYFNEPGYEHTEGQPEAEKLNIGYSNVVKISNINYAILNQLQKPSEGFEEALGLHFTLKKDAIVNTINEWIKQAEQQPDAKYTGLVACHNQNTVKLISPPGAFIAELKDLKFHCVAAIKGLKLPTE